MEGQAPTPLRTGQMGLIREPGASLAAVQAILEEARAWGMLGFDLEWVTLEDGTRIITWCGVGHAGRAVSFWWHTLPEASQQAIKDAIKEATLPKLAHNIQADIKTWEMNFGEGAVGGLWEDCHLDSETEFLTLKGWKCFDAIKRGELVGAFHPKTGRMIFEKPVKRVSRQYTGRIMVLQGQHTRAVVSGNHRMWARARKRTAASWAGKSVGGWGFIKAGEMVAAPTDVFDVRIAPAPSVEGPDGLFSRTLELAALFVSDGCLMYRRGASDPYAVRVSQIRNGRANKLLDKLALKFGARYHETVKKEEWRRKRTVECVWTFELPGVASLFYNYFGRYSRERFLHPATVLLWRKEARRVFFETLFLGDGSKVWKNTWRYCTASKRLADGVQFLALSLGYPATIGRSGSTFAVSVRPDLKGKPRTIRARESGQNAAFKHSRKVKDKRIVCFVMPSGTLVTRSKGKPAFHGNTLLMHHAAYPGIAHDLQEVTSQFLVVPPWKTWHRDAEKAKKEADKAAVAAQKQVDKDVAKDAKDIERVRVKVAAAVEKFQKQLDKFREKYTAPSVDAAEAEFREMVTRADVLHPSQVLPRTKKEIEAAEAEGLEVPAPNLLDEMAALYKRLKDEIIPPLRVEGQVAVKAAKAAAHEAKNAAAKEAKAAKKAGKQAEHEAKNAAAAAEKSAKRLFTSVARNREKI